MKPKFWIQWTLAAVILLAGCNSLAEGQPTATASLRGTEPVRQPSLTATATTMADGLEWKGRTIYQKGLVKSQKAASQLDKASMYHIEIKIAGDYASLSGRERVRYTNQESATLSEIYFQLFPNLQGGATRITSVKVNGSSVETSLEYGQAALRVPFQKGLSPGEAAVIDVEFEVSLPGESGGNYGLFGYIDGILVLDGFYPAIPVHDASGWHAGPLPPNADTTFQDVSFYRVIVTAPEQLTLASSGVAVETLKAGGMQTATFAAGPARDFYLAGSEQYVKTSARLGETTVNSYALPGMEKYAKVALDVAVAALKGFSRRLGEYAYTEFDVVSTPMQGALGIEYPGIVGINKSMYSADELSRNLEGTVAHEVGHQWFYAMLGNDQMNSPWLDESLTQYLTGTYFLDRYGQEAFAGYRQSWFSRWERVERKAIPIGLPAEQYEGAAYGGIVYGRGPVFVETLAEKMGQQVFDEFFRDYFSANRWGIVYPADFEAAAERYCGCSLDGLLAEWVYP